MRPPCKDCVDRSVGCHSTCKKYKQFKEDHEKVRKEIKKEQMIWAK